MPGSAPVGILISSHEKPVNGKHVNHYVDFEPRITEKITKLSRIYHLPS